MYGTRTRAAERFSPSHPERIFSALCAALAVLWIVLSCIGLYGLLAYMVARQTGEIGLRLALGAQRREG